MKSTLFYAAFLLLASQITAQNKTPKDFGYTHLTYLFQNDTVDILIKSKKGEEHLKKPLFFFCQGSLPKPLIKYSAKGNYPVFPFDTEKITQKYHLVIVGKPHIPVISDTKTLGREFSYIDANGNYPKAYSDRNLLQYYSARNLAVIKYLQKQDWVSKSRLVVAGHSEGSTVAAKMASLSKSITHLIYSGGNPMGRIMSILEQSRQAETDSTRYAESNFEYWKEVTDDKNSMATTGLSDTNKATYEFSLPPIGYMENLKIPVLVSYGTKDYSSPYNDYLRADCILKKRKNFSFNAYIGTEHNYFPLGPDNRPNFDIYNWDKVADDWLSWLEKN